MKVMKLSNSKKNSEVVVDSPVKQTQMKKGIVSSKVSGGWVNQIMNIEKELWLLGRGAKEFDLNLLNDLQPDDEIQILKFYVEPVLICQKKVVQAGRKSEVKTSPVYFFES